MTATRRSFIVARDVGIEADEAGDPQAPTVLLLHGGGQTRHSWGGALSEFAAAGYRALAFDARGHGDSDWPADGDYSPQRLRDDLRDIVVSLGDGPVALVGASMGGLAAMLLAATGVASVKALVLVDIVARFEERGVENIRRFMTSHLVGFATLEEAADAVAAYNPQRPRPRDLEGLKKNLRLVDGRWRWHWDPRFVTQPESLRLSPPRDRQLLLAAAPRVDIPTLIVHGLRSDVVSAEGAGELVSLMPRCEVATVADAGHMISGDRNDAFNRTTLAFLRRQLELVTSANVPTQPGSADR